MTRRKFVHVFYFLLLWLQILINIIVYCNYEKHRKWLSDMLNELDISLEWHGNKLILDVWDAAYNSYRKCMFLPIRHYIRTHIVHGVLYFVLRLQFFSFNIILYCVYHEHPKWLPAWYNVGEFHAALEWHKGHGNKVNFPAWDATCNSNWNCMDIV